MQVHKIAPATEIVQTKEQQPRGYSSWWTWRRSGGVKRDSEKSMSKEPHDAELPASETSVETNNVATQATGTESPSDNSKPIALDKSNSSENVLDLSDDGQSGELYRKSLRLTTDQIVSATLQNSAFTKSLTMFYNMISTGKPQP